MSTDERKRAGFEILEPPEAAPAALETRPRDRSRSTAAALPIKGCLVRLAVFAFLLIALLAGGLYLLVGDGVQRFVVDLGQSTGVMTGTPEQTTRGIEAFRRGDFVLAEQEFSQAAVTYPRSALALLYLAKMRTDSGDLSKAGEYLQTAVLREPNSALAHRELGLNYLGKARAAGRHDTGRLISTADLDEADRQFAAASTLDPDDRIALGYRGCTLAELGAEEQASRLLSLAGDGPWHQCRHLRAGDQ